MAQEDHGEFSLRDVYLVLRRRYDADQAISMRRVAYTVDQLVLAGCFDETVWEAGGVEVVSSYRVKKQLKVGV